MKGYYVITFFIANIIRQTVTEPERRYACWGSFGPPVISAQCPRGTVIQVLKAGLKVKQGTGPCVYKDSDCGCEYGQPACNVDNVRERCMGRPACRLDVTQQYINTPSCNGFTDYMYIEFNCVPMGTTSLHNICVTDVTVSESGYIRSPNYPHNYPKNRYCLCNLRTLPESTIKVSILDLDRQHQGQECSHPTLLLRHDDDQRLLCSSHNDGIREINTGRSSITVVMETDEVASSGGFWLKYEASPEAMVQMECFGEFNKANSADSKKAEIPTLYLDAQVDAERSEDVPTFNQTTQDISNESIIQSEGSIQDDDEELVAREISATLERLPDAVLLSKDDETLPNQDPEEQNIDLEDDNDEMLRKQTANAVTSQSVAKQSQKDSNTDADPELLFDEDYIDVETDLIPNDNITDEEFDSIIQTILDQIEGADGARALELPAGDKLDEELLVNIAELMANELSDDNPTAKVAPPRNSSRNPKGADPDVVPLEYDNIEELLARERLQIPDYDIPVTDGDKPKPRKFRPRRPENRAVSTNPGLQSHEDRKLALIPSDTKMNENRGRAVHQTTSVRRRRPQVTPKSRARADSKKPWWFKFTLEDDYPEMYADQEHKPKGNEVRQRPEVRTAQPINVNRRRTGGGMDEKKIRLLQKPRQRDISFEEERMTVGQRQGVRVPPALFLNGMPGDGARAITEKDDDDKNLAWSLDGQQHPNPSHPLQNPATNNRNPKGELPTYRGRVRPLKHLYDQIEYTLPKTKSRTNPKPGPSPAPSFRRLSRPVHPRRYAGQIHLDPDFDLRSRRADRFPVKVSSPNTLHMVANVPVQSRMLEPRSVTSENAVSRHAGLLHDQILYKSGSGFSVRSAPGVRAPGERSDQGAGGHEMWTDKEGMSGSNLSVAFVRVTDDELSKEDELHQTNRTQFVQRTYLNTGNKAADKATGKNVQQDEILIPTGADSEDSMTVILIAAGAIGCVLLIIVVGVLIKFAVNKTNPHRAWRRRHPPKVLRKQPYLHKHPSFGSALP